MDYGFVFARRKIRDFRLWLWWNLLTSKVFFRRVGKNPTVRTVRKILSEFCAEAAVLIFIFPYLDFLIESRQESGQTARTLPVDMRSVLVDSIIISLGFLIASVIFAIKTPSERE